MNKFCQNALAFGPGLFAPHCLNSKASAIVDICADSMFETYYLCDACAGKLTAKARSKKLKAKVDYVETNNKLFKRIVIFQDTYSQVFNE